MSSRDTPSRSVRVTVVLDCDVWDELPYWASAAAGKPKRMTPEQLRGLVEERMREFVGVFDSYGQKIRARDVVSVVIEP